MATLLEEPTRTTTTTTKPLLPLSPVPVTQPLPTTSPTATETASAPKPLPTLAPAPAPAPTAPAPAPTSTILPPPPISLAPVPAPAPSTPTAAPPPPAMPAPSPTPVPIAPAPTAPAPKETATAGTATPTAPLSTPLPPPPPIPTASVTAGEPARAPAIGGLAESAVPIDVPQPVLLPGDGMPKPDGALPRGGEIPTLPGGEQPPAPTAAGTEIGDLDPTLTPTTVPDVPGGVPDPNSPITPFTETDNLRNQQINPLATARLRALQQQVDELQRGAMGAPALREAAAEQLRLLEEQSQPGFETNLRTVGQRAAALGRLGSGMTTSDLGDVTQRREQALSIARRQLAADTTGAEAQDRLARLSAAAGLEGQLYGQEQGARGELRGERDYQSAAAREALDRRVQQRVLEDTLANSATNRAVAEAGVGLRGAELLGGQAEDQFGTAEGLAEQLALEEYLRRQRAALTGTRPPDQTGVDYDPFADPEDPNAGYG